MQIDEVLRKSLSIAQTFDELCQFSLSVTSCGRTGYPVLLIPFGSSDGEGEVYVQDETTLFSVGPEALENGVFGLVHVLKAREQKDER